VNGLIDPAGAEARLQAPLHWTLVGGAALLFALVMLLLALALSGRLRRVPTRAWLVGGGLALPLAVLSALQVANLSHMAALAAAPPPGAMVISVSGRLWWWELRVQVPGGDAAVVAANELVLPVGRTVRLALASDDVIHSVWIPALAGKVDLIPGRINHLVVRAEREGRWRGPCAEFCGGGHATMVLDVVALAPSAFDAWLAAQRADATAPRDAAAARGLARFRAERCDVCHAVRGLVQPVLGGAHGGPDLTHLASRATLGAGALPNEAAGLRAWIADASRFKPGVRMPAYAHLDADALDDLAAWLGTLR
jgi:cytochrome c oxidase subunit 2